ncbi:hypothetical protein ABZW11_03490 [Nonomuraea sp. NPDC004580]
MELDYPFLDASRFKMHDGSRAEPILPLAEPGAADFGHQVQ